MKILFTSVGRRVELIQAFKEAGLRKRMELEIHGADFSSSAPALFFCDKIHLVPKISDVEYIPFLLNICKNEHIEALIPTIDTDLLILSKNRLKFEMIGTKVFIANQEKIEICRNKLLTAKYLTDMGLHSPIPVNNILDYKEGYPAFIKPKDGSSSINAFKVNNYNELVTYSEQIEDYIVAPFIDGIEYTVDAFCDYEGNPLLITPRIRLAVRSGEVLKTEIRQDESIIEEVKKILNDFKPRGQITIQLIKEKTSNFNYYIEINPRFGGGAPLSIKAGADSAEMLLCVLNDEKVDYIEKAAEDGAIFSRFDQSIRIK